MGTPKMIPLCPKCGEPPRFKTTVRVVRVEVWREKDKLVEGNTKWAGAPLSGFDTEYECGGGHRWEVPPEENKS